MLARFQRVVTYPLVKYNDLLERRPLLTKSITTGAMYGGGDIIAQYVEWITNDDKDKKPFCIDRRRALVFTLFGTVVGGPAFHYWYNYLNEVPALLWQLKKTQQRGKILRAYAYLKSHGIEVKLDKTKLPVAAPLGKWQNKFVKLFADQVIFASGYLFIFFMGVGVLTKAAERTEVLYGPRTPMLADKPEPSTPAEAAELLSRLKRSNPAVADLVTQLKERSRHQPQPDRQLDSENGELDLQVHLIDEILQRIHQDQQIQSKELSWKAILRNTWQHTREVYLGTYMVDCMFWPPLQLINFTFVPVRLQFLFVNTVSLLWNTFLSLMANKEKKAH